MNALVSIESIGVLTPATVFAPGGVEGILSKIETEVRAIDRDISTPDGRENVKSLAYKVARSKTALDEMGKELVAGIKAQAATIDAERRTIRERLDALKDEVRGPLTAWETAEAERVSKHEQVLTWIIGSDRFFSQPTAADVRKLIGLVADHSVRDWQEFKERADTAIAEALAKLNPMLQAAEQAERDAAELAELRRLKAEREEADRAAAEAAAKAAREAAEKARREEEELAKREWMEKHRAEAAARAAKQAEESAARAVEQERQRAAAEKAAQEAAQQKRAANKRHRAKVEGTAIESLALHIPREHAEKAVAAIAALAILHINIEY